MARRFAFIRNPLTVVGVFAGVAEVSGVWVLPKLSPELEGIFIWFVMLFPAFLVAMFFLTLNFNPKCLYAPSDYRDDAAFMDTITGARRLTAREHQQQERTSAEAAPGASASRNPAERTSDRG